MLMKFLKICLFQFPVDTDIEKRLHSWFEKSISKKDVVKELMKLVNRALDDGNKEEFNRLCKIYKNIQIEFKYY